MIPAGTRDKFGRIYTDFDNKLGAFKSEEDKVDQTGMGDFPYTQYIFTNGILNDINNKEILQRIIPDTTAVGGSRGGSAPGSWRKTRRQKRKQLRKQRKSRRN
jgi:hypothetical protein